jgi:hypothetical protein
MARELCVRCPERILVCSDCQVHGHMVTTQTADRAPPGAEQRTQARGPQSARINVLNLIFRELQPRAGIKINGLALQQTWRREAVTGNGPFAC